MDNTRNFAVSIARPSPTMSSHQPGRGSDVDDVACLDAEIPPRTATTGRPAAPTISYEASAASTGVAHSRSSARAVIGLPPLLLRVHSAQQRGQRSTPRVRQGDFACAPNSLDQ